MKILPKTFRFSPTATILSVALAAVMIWCSTWQWERYKAKKELVASYRQHSTSVATPLPPTDTERELLLDKKILLNGTFDYDRESIVLNKKHASGPGHWLVTPFKLDNSDERILVSRGFIPFENRTAADWEKYRTNAEQSIEGVLKRSKGKRLPFSPAADDVPDDHTPRRKWLYVDATRIAETLPYPVNSRYFVQSLEWPESGEFPAPSVSVEVPPSTHFGYTIEWALLAMGSLAMGFVYQAWPRRHRLEQ